MSSYHDHHSYILYINTSDFMYEKQTLSRGQSMPIKCVSYLLGISYQFDIKLYQQMLLNICYQFTDVIEYTKFASNLVSFC